MSKYTPGDKVTPINVNREGYTGPMRQLMGKTMAVTSISEDRRGNEIVRVEVPDGTRCWSWYAQDLRLVSKGRPEPVPNPTDPAPEAAKKPQPLRRGDLVVSNGDIYVVIETNHADGGYWIHAMTGKGGQDYARAKELTRIGSIRKKVERLKAAIAKAGGES